MTGGPDSICRLLPFEFGDGPENMARDEALLDLVTRDPTSPALRTYGWAEPTLSLGYFQGIGEVEADRRWDGARVVRRFTGGGAIWHDRELTYALALPRSHPFARQGEALYRAVHRVFADLLREAGLDARRREESRTVGSSGRPLLCFTDKDPEDLVVGASKVVGSAQRRRNGAILQHGSLLLSRSARTPELPGVADLADVSDDLSDWSDLIRSRIPEALGLRAEQTGWPDESRRIASRLAADVYGARDWTRRR